MLPQISSMPDWLLQRIDNHWVGKMSTTELKRSCPRSLCKVPRTYLFFVKKKLRVSPIKSINQRLMKWIRVTFFTSLSLGGKKPSTVGTEFWISWFLSSPFKFRDHTMSIWTYHWGGAEKTSKNITQNGETLAKIGRWRFKQNWHMPWSKCAHDCKEPSLSN